MQHIFFCAWRISLSIRSSSFIYSVDPSSLRLNNILRLSLQIDGHLGSFYILSVVNNAAMHMAV